MDCITPERERLQPIFALYSPCNAFNFDKTALLTRAHPESGLSNRPMSGGKKDKTRLTFGLCANANGSKKRPPFILGFSKQPRLFKGRTAAQLGFDYDNNSSAWMTDMMWNKWLRRFDADMQRQGRNILLLVDNASGHKKFDPNLYPNVRVEFLAPGLTAFLQPLDLGVICCFKAHFRQAHVRRAIARLDAGKTNIYHTKQLEGMEMGRAAWEAVAQSTVINCWRHTGICPPSYFPADKSNESDVQDTSIVSDIQDGLDLLSSRQPVLAGTTCPSAREFIDMDQHIETGAPPSEEAIADEIRQSYKHIL
ncbi:DDE superfamily endonuclease [Rhizoctonia solani]|uniref:DDE superfamily endonuclease n=1 Tax=Rhizoctonia solani TaxID=456999 RepID=A0A8H7H306_9AGAM|nr:DDE superfamily endonuclease [Rhizoctonia solani]